MVNTRIHAVDQPRTRAASRRRLTGRTRGHRRNRLFGAAGALLDLHRGRSFDEPQGRPGRRSATSRGQDRPSACTEPSPRPQPRAGPTGKHGTLTRTRDSRTCHPDGARRLRTPSAGLRTTSQRGGRRPRQAGGGAYEPPGSERRRSTPRSWTEHDLTLLDGPEQSHQNGGSARACPSPGVWGRAPVGTVPSVARGHALEGRDD